MKNTLNKSKKRGATLIEYALIAAIISVGSITAMNSVSDKIGQVFDSIVTKLNSAI